MKQCTRCTVKKPKADFNKQKATKDGLNVYCRVCVKEKYDERMAANKNRKVDWEGTKVCLICKKDKPKTQFSGNTIVKSGINSSCKDCYNTKSRSSWIANKKVYNKRQRDLHNNDPLRLMYYKAKSRAKKEGIPFNITPEDLKLPELCPVLGIPLEVGKGKLEDNSPSLDKFIPELGYVKGNVFVISMLANCIKRDATTEQVEAVGKWMRGIINKE